jgi:tetratricopeptide (TPR) repeat protein
LFSTRPIRDLTGRALDAIETGSEADEPYFWFDPPRLAGFVDDYRRLGGEAYALFLVDSFLWTWLWPELVSTPYHAGVRLPYLPRADEPVPAGPLIVPGSQGIRVDYFGGFGAKKRTRANSASLMPVLKLLETRACRELSESDPPSSAPCPTYSAMALLTEMLRQYPERIRERSGFGFGEVFSVAADRGLCEARQYPLLPHVLASKKRVLDEFSRDAERELNKLIEHPPADPETDVAGFLESGYGGAVAFVEGLPPQCRQEMKRVAGSLQRHDLVAALASQDQLIAIPEDRRRELHRAQRDELYRTTLDLIDSGIPVAIAGNDEPLDYRQVTAYGRDPEGLVIMDSGLNDGASRRRSVIPYDQVRTSIYFIGYLRDDLEPVESWKTLLERVEALAPRVAWVQHHLGWLYREEDRFSIAASHLRRAVELEPTRARAWQDLGKTLAEIGEYEPALAAWRRSVELGLDSAYAHRSLGYVLERLGRFADAAVEYRVSLESDADSTWALGRLGWALFEIGQGAEAEECFQRVLEISPDEVWDHLDLASFYFYSGERERAFGVLTAFDESRPDADDRVRIATRMIRFGFESEGREVLDAILAADPDHRDARFELGRLNHDQGRHEDAVAVLEPLEHELRALVSGDSVAIRDRIDLAYVQTFSGDVEASRASVDEIIAGAIEIGRGDYYEFACIAALNGDDETALRYLRESLALGNRNFRWMLHDPDFGTLAEDARFRALLAEYRAGSAGTGN